MDCPIEPPGSSEGHLAKVRRAARRPGLSLLACLAVLVPAAALAVPLSQARSVADELGKSVVNIRVAGRQGDDAVSMASFSGFVLQGEKGLILGCCANVKWLLEQTKGRLEVTYEDLWHGTADLKAFDEDTGVCLVDCANPNPPAGIPLEPSSGLSPGTAVLTIANSYGIHPSAWFGVVLGPDCGGAGGSCLAIRLKLDAARGREGGVVCDLERGFGGVVLPADWRPPAHPLPAAIRPVAGFPAMPQVRVLPARAVKIVVDRLKRNEPILRGWIGAGFKVAADEGGELTCVKSVKPGGPAASAGLREGHILLEANGKRMATIADLFELAFWVEYEGLGRDLVLVVREANGAARIVVPVGLRPKG